MVIVTSTFLATGTATAGSTAADARHHIDGSVVTAQQGHYHAVIRRTEHGVPHVLAADIKSAGFGQGYAYAEDRGCDLADQVVKLRSERSRWFGPGSGNENLASDFGYRALDIRSRAERELKTLSPDVRSMVTGYVAGFNAYFERTGSLPGWCAGAPWVGRIDEVDLLSRERDLAITMGGATLLGAITLAQPPTGPDAAQGGASARSGSRVGGDDATPSRERVAEQAGPVLRGERRTASLGSNGWAVGSERTANRAGLLVANPHFPWEGENRFWESQLTVPGRLQVYGASLGGLPGVQIGYNRDVAWTHTVSAGWHTTVYTVKLTEQDPTRYLVDGKPEAMTSRTHAVQVKSPDGSLQTVRRTLWQTKYGPVIDLSPADPSLGWSPRQAVTFQDANIGNDALLEQYADMAMARSVGEVEAAHRRHQAIPWMNTIAADKSGATWYADSSATPNLSAEGISAWMSHPYGVLDGSNSRNAWQKEPGAREPGLVPFGRQPQLGRRDYVFNANDSHWLANPASPLTGYSPLFGFEGVPQSARTRQNAFMLREDGPGAISGADGRISLPEAENGLMSTRAFTSDWLLAPVVKACRAQADAPVVVDGAKVDVSKACDVLADWDGRFAVGSRGAVLWRETIAAVERARPGAVTNAGPLFGTAFDPARPVDTPAGPAADTAPVLEGLAKATLTLEAAGLPADVPLGQVQQATKGDVKLPVPGTAGFLGATNVVEHMARPGSSLEPATPGGTPVRYGDLTDRGYPVNTGSSFMLAVSFTPQGPMGKGLLTMGQSIDPHSPHFGDQTEAFARLELKKRPFSEREILADPHLDTEVVTGRVAR
ncbi:penicillin acylase family protein [Kitasatospora sp. NPDC101235]|uniref:penicillin acylase family protein n=1 Tax=Kitasatospora sp. NPDC101235 TaxID=3364101 RepID=UPI00381F91F2